MTTVQLIDLVAGTSLQVIEEEGVGCGCCANIGKPLTLVGSGAAFKSIVGFNVAARDEHFNRTGSYVKIFTYTVDDAPTMEWLVRRVDGVITNKPKILAQIVAEYNIGY